MTKNKRGLGRGLDALFDEKPVIKKTENNKSINFISKYIIEINTST